MVEDLKGELKGENNKEAQQSLISLRRSQRRIEGGSQPRLGTSVNYTGEDLKGELKEEEPLPLRMPP